MQNILVSIIVPVFNVESVLANCIDSIISQTYKNIEVILINDGSKDKSGEICDGYKTRDKRISVHHQKNLGASEARNTGLKHAKGTFIQFVDADDTISQSMTETLVNSMVSSKSDLVICSYNLISKNHNKINVNSKKLNFSGSFDKAQFKTMFFELYLKSFILSPCNKLYRSSLINSNHLTFNKKFQTGNDGAFNFEYLDHITAVSFVPDLLYNYNIFNSGLTAGFKKNRLNYFISRHKFILQVLKKYDVPEVKIMEYDKKYFPIKIRGVLLNILHKNSPYRFSRKYYEFRTVIKNEFVRNKLPHFKNAVLIDKFIGVLIQKKQIFLLFLFMSCYKTTQNLIRK